MKSPNENAEITLQLSRKRNHIVVTENVFDEDGFGDASGRRGIVPLAPGSDPDEMLEKALEYNWELGAEPDLNGFYKVTKGAKVGEVIQNEK